MYWDEIYHTQIVFMLVILFLQVLCFKMARIVGKHKAIGGATVVNGNFNIGMTSWRRMPILTGLFGVIVSVALLGVAFLLEHSSTSRTTTSTPLLMANVMDDCG